MTKSLYNKKNKVYDLINDEYKELLWGLRLINLEETWSKISNLDLCNIKIGLIDSGVDRNHEDLKNIVIEGFNFIDNSKDTTDHFGHGTRVAGIIGAEKNNKIGIAGVASGVQIVPLKVMDHRGKANIKNIIKALEWCMNNDIDIINLSLGYYKDCLNILTNKNSQDYFIEEEIVSELIKKSVPIISAVGNGYGKETQYPAAYSSVISVASCGIKLSPFHLYASPKNNKCKKDTIYAPGEYIYTTDIRGNYVYDFGSSMACGFVTGAIALLKSQNKALSPKKLKNLLLDHSQKITTPNEEIKFLNVDNAFNELQGF